MNLYTFQIPLFRDKTKLRYIKDGRLIIKSEVSSLLDLSNREYLFYYFNKIDINEKKIECVLSTENMDNCKMLRLESIRDNRIVHLKGQISQYGIFKSQYARYHILGINSFCVELYY